MTKLTYLVTTPKGETKKVSTLAEALELGGFYTVCYEPIVEPNRVDPARRKRTVEAIVRKAKERKAEEN